MQTKNSETLTYYNVEGKNITWCFQKHRMVVSDENKPCRYKE